MTVHDISPAFLQIGYSSQYGRHHARIPTVPLIENVGGTAGGLDHWTMDLRGAEIDVNAETAIDAFIAVWKACIPPTSRVNEVLLYKKPDADSVALPVASKSYDAVGTYSEGSFMTDRATQRTFTYRTELFNAMKLVFLDVPIVALGKSKSVAGSGPFLALNAYVTADASFIAGRDGGRPTLMVSVSTDINDRLQRAYTR